MKNAKDIRSIPLQQSSGGQSTATPQHRIEEYLDAIRAACLGESPLPAYPNEPVWRIEHFLHAILSAAKGDSPAAACPQPAWRFEEYLRAIYDAMTGAVPAWPCPAAPTTRMEEYLQGAYDRIASAVETPLPTPAWTIEALLAAAVEAIQTAETYGPAAVVSVETDGSKEIRSFLIHVEPTQSGSGDPTPSNPRPITGWTGANAYISPTQQAADGTVSAISWQSEAGTIYGGTVDLVRGTLTVDRACIDLGEKEWVRFTSGTNPIFYIKSGTMTGYKPYADRDVVDAICSAYAAGWEARSRSVLATNLPNKTMSWIAGEDGMFVIRNDDYTTPQDLKTSLSGVQLVYYLAEPVTFQLTPQQLSTVSGQNYMWSNAGNVTVMV